MLSNNNPAGVNQGLSQHPLPENGGIHVLGASGTTIPNVPIPLAASPTDVLLVAAPAAGSGVVRRIYGSETGGNFGYIKNLSAAATTVGSIVYKDGSGNEAILQSGVTIGAGGTEGMNLDGDFFLTEDDAGGGLYFRVGAVLAADPGIEGYAQSQDVRGVERYITPISNATGKVGLLPAIPYGEALRVFSAPGEEAPASCWFLNYDTADHGVAVTTTLFDAVGEVGLENNGNVPAGTGTPYLDADSAVAGTQGRGENINAIDAGIDVADTTPVIMVAVVRTNQGPVKPEQGGAY